MLPKKPNPKCQHSPQFVRQEPHGEDRIIKHYRCRHCGKTTKRNLKKPRFVPKTKEAKPRKPMRSRSLKRQKQEAEYAKLRKAFLEDHPVCQVCGLEEANQIHHRLHREGKRLNDQTYWLAVGPLCHLKIHDQPAWAKQHGYLL